MHLYPTLSATYRIMLVLPADVGPSSSTGSSVPAMARKRSFKCALNVSVRWNISDLSSLKLPLYNKNPEIKQVLGDSLGSLSL